MFIFAVAASAAFAAEAYGQDCRATDSNLTNGSFTASAKTGGCVKYRFEARPGQRLIVTLRSTDNKARFDLQDGAEDETGSISTRTRRVLTANSSSKSLRSK